MCLFAASDVAELLLDRGAALDGTGGWSPLEEALYCCFVKDKATDYTD